MRESNERRLPGARSVPRCRLWQVATESSKHSGLQLVMGEPSKAVDSKSSAMSPHRQITAACSGAFITSIFMTPLDVVKVRLQAQQRELLNRRCFLYCNGLMDHICSCQPIPAHTQRQWYSRAIPGRINGTLDGLIKIGRYEGISSLWSGLPPTLVVAVPNTVIYFTAYEQIRWGLSSSFGSDRWWVPGVAGGVARVWSVSMCSPLELIRTKLQAARMPYSELLVLLTGELRRDGVRSLFRGWAATVLRDVPFSVLYWGAYEHLKKMYGQQERPTVPFTVLAGSVAGGVAATVTLPLDVVKTHRQIDIGERDLFPASPSDHLKRKSGGSSESTWRHLCSIYRQQGVPGLFSGLSPRLVKVMPACAIMISSYEYIKNHLRRAVPVHGEQYLFMESSTSSWRAVPVHGEQYQFVESSTSSWRAVPVHGSQYLFILYGAALEASSIARRIATPAVLVA
ncbi:Mitochondrial substrate/solute carrier [Trinorchestia longiramus]|nr:Mitochondrial substrate/solute carrier [Trinorchestia longiramus]